MDLTLMTNFLDSKDDAHNISGTAAAIFLIISKFFQQSQVSWQVEVKAN